jgi:chromosome segregation ATPase
LDLARWLTFEERAAITKVGGLHRNINAEWPKPVLGPAEKRQLASEQLRAERELAVLEAHVSGLQKRLVEPRASLAAFHRSVEASQRWWGLRASREDKAMAKIADKAIPNLKAEIAELEAELEVTQSQLRAKREHLFL